MSEPSSTPADEQDPQPAADTSHDDTTATTPAAVEQPADVDPATAPARTKRYALAVVHTLWNTVTIVAVHVVAIGVLEKTPLLALLTLR